MAAALGTTPKNWKVHRLLMNKLVIIPYQKIILDTLDKIFQLNNWKVEITIETLQPSQWLEGQSDDADATTDDKDTFGRQGVAVITEELVKPIINHLKKKGEKREDLEKEGWVLIQDENQMTREGVKLRLMPVGFSDISSNPEDPSFLDKGLYKIRYEYRGPRDDKTGIFALKCWI
jgi:hypothetical protein